MPLSRVSHRWRIEMSLDGIKPYDCEFAPNRECPEMATLDDDADYSDFYDDLSAKELVVDNALNIAANVIGSMEAMSEDSRVSIIAEVADVLIACLGRNGKVFFAGNGGSFAQALHFAGELLGKFRIRRNGLPAIALGSNTAAMTAIANDFDFDRIFVRELKALAFRGDVLVVISTSGKSKNLVEAARVASDFGLVLVALIGNDTNCILAHMADHVISVPYEDTPRVQEAHLVIGHTIVELVEEEMFGEGYEDRIEKL